MKRSTCTSVGTLGAGVIALLGVTQATNAAIVYDEGVSGDLNGTRTEPVLSFSNGVNSVIGNTTAANTGAAAYDPDSFAFTIPNGSQLTSITANYSNIGLFNPTSFVKVSYNFRELDSTIIGSTPLEEVTAGSQPISISGLPLGPETYTVTTNFGRDGGIDGGGSYDYQLDFNVSAVPLPAAAWLFGSALVGAGIIGRRKKKAV